MSSPFAAKEQSSVSLLDRIRIDNLTAVCFIAVLEMTNFVLRDMRRLPQLEGLCGLHEGNTFNIFLSAAKHIFDLTYLEAFIVNPRKVISYKVRYNGYLYYVPCLIFHHTLTSTPLCLHS
jgi:hypothetical protein